MTGARATQQITRQLAFEGTMYGRTTLRVFVHIRPDGSISSGEAVEMLPDGSEQQRAVICYQRDIARVSPLLRRMNREHQRAVSEPATVLGPIDGEYWLRELGKRIDPGCVFASRGRPGV